MTRTIVKRGRAVAACLVLWSAGAPAASPASSAAPGGNPAAAPAGSATSPAPSSACPKVLDVTLPRLQDDAPQNLCQYAGRVVLVVNTASFCGFTHQYQGLERLYDRYRARGFVVLGFPSNDFGQQEPGSNREIAEFCENTFSVKFPMFAKSRVAGAGANPVFATLARTAGVAPGWNFHKYLIGRDGRVVGHFPSKVDPLDRRLLQEIEKLL
ncbi:MAG: glutathione peroxidase [Burkholderiaceae bacterium]